MKEIKINSEFTQEMIVSKDQLASHIGSGVVDVFATPMMIAFMENTAVKCLEPFMEEGETTVGICMNSTHDAATPVGMKVTCTATITAVERKKISFCIVAKDEKDIIGKATHDRFLVIKEKFETKAKQKAMD